MQNSLSSVIGQTTAQFLVSAKRTRAERTGVHGWHPYYAGYSEAFVEGALRHLATRKDMLVLDPWAGSGTTCIVSSRAQFVSVGIDINPVMATFTAAKNPSILKNSDAILSYFSQLSISDESHAVDEPDPLLNVFTDGSAKLLRAVWMSLDEHAGTNAANPVLDPQLSFLKAVMFVTLRKLSGSRKRSNPTWKPESNASTAITKQELSSLLTKEASTMLAELNLYYKSTDCPRKICSFNCNASAMPLADESVDRVITSPPYLTRIDYAVSTAPELGLIGSAKLFTEVRHATTGAPVITKVPKEQRKEWGPICNLLLDQVRAHSTKAAASYYWKNMVQYFDDIAKALLDIWRVMKSGSTGLIVVQSSYFKEIEICLGEIFVEMASLQGFVSSIAYRDEVKGHMAHVNTRSNKYVAKKIYYEDTIFIQKP